MLCARFLIFWVLVVFGAESNCLIFSFPVLLKMRSNREDMHLAPPPFALFRFDFFCHANNIVLKALQDNRRHLQLKLCVFHDLRFFCGHSSKQASVAMRYPWLFRWLAETTFALMLKIPLSDISSGIKLYFLWFD